MHDSSKIFLLFKTSIREIPRLSGFVREPDLNNDIKNTFRPS